MKRILFLSSFLIFFSSIIFAQEEEKSNSSLNFGGYGAVYSSKELGTKEPAELDVQRIILTTDYSFSSKTRFFSELEFEHVYEVGVEQAWVEHKINKFVNFKAGLLLIPMGIINEFHENNTFNGVARPLIDKYVVPTTWREIGAGFTGTIINANLSYQLYMVNGFNGYDNTGHLNAKYPFRKGRQKGAESYMSSPNFSARISYFGLPKTKIGLSAYTGNTQTKISSSLPQATIDSSKVHMNMLGADAQVNLSALQFKAQYYYVSLENTAAYNYFSGLSTGEYLAKNIWGYYTEIAYNVFSLGNFDSRLDLFARYEAYDTQAKMEKDFIANENYKVTDITYGITWKPTPKIAFKADVQSLKNKAENEWKHSLNLGIGFSF